MGLVKMRGKPRNEGEPKTREIHRRGRSHASVHRRVHPEALPQPATIAASAGRFSPGTRTQCGVMLNWALTASGREPARYGGTAEAVPSKHETPPGTLPRCAGVFAFSPGPCREASAFSRREPRWLPGASNARGRAATRSSLKTGDTLGACQDGGEAETRRLAVTGSTHFSAASSFPTTDEGGPSGLCGLEPFYYLSHCASGSNGTLTVANRRVAPDRRARARPDASARARIKATPLRTWSGRPPDPWVTPTTTSSPAVAPPSPGPFAWTRQCSAAERATRRGKATRAPQQTGTAR